MKIKVPPLGESITKATVGRWHKAVGETVVLDDILVELETDKITLEVSATAAGRLDEIAAPEGEDVEVGGLLARIVEDEAGIAPQLEQEIAPEPEPELAAEATHAVELAALSPAVRRLIDEYGLDPAAISGSGKRARILKADVLAALEGASAPTAEVPVPTAPAALAVSPGPRPEAAREKRVRMTRLRQRIAERLTAAQAQSALLTTFNEVDMTSVIETRRLFRDRFEAKHGVKLGFMSFFAKAAVAALKEIPNVNAEIEGDEIVYKDYFHIGVAVSAPQGLVVPVLRDVDRLSLAAIEASIAALSQRAHDGKLNLENLSGGTFTISNGGIFGSLLSTPIVNPPQSAILGMHKIQERPVAVDGRVEIRPMMYLALSYDHRLIDGREAVTFLVRIKELIEHPEGALLDL